MAVAAGDLPTAREILAAAAARAAAADLRVAEARLLHDLARLGQPGQVAPRLAELAQMAGGELLAALAGHAAALAVGGAAAGALDRLGAALLAAEAYTAAAAAYRSGGLARRAAAAARRAAELAAVCGDVKTLAVAVGPAARRLTRREQEVASLAAAGCLQPRDRRTARDVGADRGKSPAQRLHHARRHQPRRPGPGAALLTRPASGPPHPRSGPQPGA